MGIVAVSKQDKSYMVKNFFSERNLLDDGVLVFVQIDDVLFYY